MIMIVYDLFSILCVFLYLKQFSDFRTIMTDHENHGDLRSVFIHEVPTGYVIISFVTESVQECMCHSF